MRAIPILTASTLLVLSAGGALAQGAQAETAGGRGQDQAAPSSEAKAPVVMVPAPAATAGGPGQNQAAPSSEAKALVPVRPNAAAVDSAAPAGADTGATTGGAAATRGSGCPPAAAGGEGVDRSGEVAKPGEAQAGGGQDEC